MWNAMNIIELAAEQRQTRLQAAEEWRQYRDLVAARSEHPSGKQWLRRCWQNLVVRWPFKQRQALKLQENR